MGDEALTRPPVQLQHRDSSVMPAPSSGCRSHRFWWVVLGQVVIMVASQWYEIGRWTCPAMICVTCGWPLMTARNASEPSRRI